MSERLCLRRQVASRQYRLQNTSSPISYRRIPQRRQLSKPSQSTKILKRCSSEPTLLTPCFSSSGIQDRVDCISNSYLVQLQQDQTCAHVLASSPSLSVGSPQSLEGYSKDAKVVITVTVEGSPGPILVMVKLGSDVEGTIKLVVDKYIKERRTPKLEGDASFFELHSSNFSIECLEKSRLIRDIGSRSFYLRRKSRSPGDESSTEENDLLRTSSQPPMSLPTLFFMSKFSEMERRVRKLVRFLLCLK